jgi:hypothetical protein
MFSEIIEQLTSTKAKTLTGYSFVNNILWTFAQYDFDMFTTHERLRYERRI